MKNIFTSLSMVSMAAILLCACSEEDTKQTHVRPVSLTEISQSDYSVARGLTGVVQSADAVDMSFEVTGKVNEVFFDIGEIFKKGQPLATLEQTRFALNVKEREGQLSESKAQLVKARQDFKRKQDLVYDGAVSKASFDLAKSQYESAKDQVDIAIARLKMAKEDLADTVLKAPYDGSVSARFIEEAQRVSPQTAALTIESNHGFEISVLVPEAMIGDVDVGQKTDIFFPARATSAIAHVKEVGSATQQASAFPVTLAMKGSVKGLRTGMSAEVTFRIGHTDLQKPQLTLPVTALLAGEDNEHFIFKASAQSETKGSSRLIAHKMPVSVLDYFDQHASIKGDVSAGEYVIDAGVSFIRDGQHVTAIDNTVRHFNP